MSSPYVVTTGTYAGTEVAQTITLGFTPSFVLAFNQTDGDLLWFHINGMTAATAGSIDTETGVESTAVTLIATGFTLGVSNVVNENGKTYVYAAFHN